MIVRWFLSKTVRQAIDLCRRVQKMVDAQRDLLTPQAIGAIAVAIGEVRTTISSGTDRSAISEQMTNLETVANKWLKPFPFAAIRENIDVVLVALVVALGFRTFFLQPMAIPTGSMQPTLYGITHEDLREKSGVRIPNLLGRVFDSTVRGISYCRVTAQVDGAFQRFGPVETVLPFVKRQSLFVGGQAHEIWFPPEKIEEWAALHEGQMFHKGDDIIKLKVCSGDRLFADRVTYNFRRPARGEIVIFITQGIDLLQQDTHYIKRLIGLGGERIQIGNDRHVIIDGKRLDAATPGFENLYTFQGPPEESHYSGHVQIGAEVFQRMQTSPKFHNEAFVFGVRPDHYFVMGDNTTNSYDSRYWGDFPREKVIGKCAFVFWPISSRFGWGFR